MNCNCFNKNVLSWNVNVYFVDHLYYCDILIFYITAILYVFAGGYNCRLTTFPNRFAHDVSIVCSYQCTALMWVIVVPWANE